ncbi:MAG: PilZ domain-containing protein [Candidatus Sulfotelmatobacter sp.]
MTTPPVGVERRAGQRFAFNLPVFVRDVPSSVEGLGFTQDLSSRGAFFFTDMPLNEGAEIELTLRMPSEITLGENMRVRCRGRVLRIVNAGDQDKDRSLSGNDREPAETKSPQTKIGVAVCLSGYEYLPDEDDGPAEFRRISALHANAPVATPAPSEPESPRSSPRPL